MWSLAILAFLLSPCIAVMAASAPPPAVSSSAVTVENEPNAVAKAEVLTTLEQRMQKKISVDFRETPIDDVIRIMAEQANVDVIKSPKVTGNVTAKLSTVPLEEALRNILASQGYDYVMTKSMIRVAPAGEISQEAEKLVSKIYRITYADIKEVEKALSKFISQRGAISTNPGTSNIIVTDTEGKINAINTFIDEIDRITPQILVEARIYDITTTDALDIGVEWNAGTQTRYYSDGQAVVPPGVMGNLKTEASDPFTTGMFRGATNKTASTTGLLKFGWFNDAIDIDAIIRAQKNLIDAKLLANPRVLVLDNEKANIKIIAELPYQEITETSGGGSIGATKFRDVGVELEVTPHLTRDEMIRMRLKPKFSVNSGEVSIVGAASNVFPVPIIDRREADTQLLVKDGQTVVLGGLRKKVVSHRVNKIPLLGDIPIICYLFRFEGESTVNSELVVFVTPKLVREAGLSGIEKQQYRETEFPAAIPKKSRAEKRYEAGVDEN
jgi:type IV pilus assembly protein PilQ